MGYWAHGLREMRHVPEGTTANPQGESAPRDPGSILQEHDPEENTMAETRLIADVDEAQFDELVIAASHERPVIVDFWASWCGPCRVIGPILERVVTSLAGRVALAKVNVDENRRLAAAWRIQSIPAVKVFRDGKPVKEFVGALPESEIRRQLAAVLPSEADEAVAEGERLAEQGKWQSAEAEYRKALAAEPGHKRATLRLAAAALRRGDVSQATGLVDQVGPDRALSAEIESLQARIWFAGRCKDSGLLEACRQRLADDPTDLGARFHLGCCLAHEGRHREALEELLAVVRADRDYEDGAAKAAMIRVFAITGQNSDLAREYRSQLTRELYV
jgi:putative thioredoxin